MISYFKVNISIRIVALLLLLLIIRLPLITSGLPLIVPEINWMLVGEKISKGALMYRDVWDNTGPLSALVYGGIHLLFGKSTLAYHIIALIITAGHMLLFNYYMMRNDLFPDRSYLPGLMYLVVSNLFPDFLTLSPVLMANTFLLPVFNITLRHIRVGLKEDDLYFVGLFVGIATLFYLPAWVFMGLPLLSLLLYSGTRPRQYMLITFGAVLPVILTGLFYFWHDELGNFIQNYLITFLSLPTRYWVTFSMIVTLLIVPSALTFFSFFFIGSSNKYTHFQSIGQQIMIIWIALTVVAAFFTHHFAPYFFILLIPAFAFFITHLVVLIKKKLFRELIFGVFAISVIGVLYGSNFGILFRNGGNNETNNLFAATAKKKITVSDKKVLVLGNNLTTYQNNSLATPYLNWELSLRHFSRLDSYSTILALYKNFSADLPDVLIDESGIAPALFDRVPLLRQKYQKVSDTEYVLKANLSAKDTKKGR